MKSLREIIDDVRVNAKGRLPLGGVGADHDADENIIALCDVLDEMLKSSPVGPVGDAVTRVTLERELGNAFAGLTRGGSLLVNAIDERIKALSNIVARYVVGENIESLSSGARARVGCHMVVPRQHGPARETACGLRLDINDGVRLSSTWSDVTCKVCLSHRASEGAVAEDGGEPVGYVLRPSDCSFCGASLQSCTCSEGIADRGAAAREMVLLTCRASELAAYVACERSPDDRREAALREDARRRK